MQPDHTSPKYVTSCPSCPESCFEIHPSSLRHHTVPTHLLQSKIESVLNQNYDQWLALFEKLETSIQHLIHEITQYLQKLDQTVNQYRNVLVLNQQQKSKEDQQSLSKAMGKISQFKYNQINCDQIDKIMLALKQKEQKGAMDLTEQFEMMEDKILFDLHEIVSMNFSCLQDKSLSKVHESLDKYAISKNEKSSKDLVKEIDPSQISRKIQEIMKEEMLKIKPLINEQISKAKSQIGFNPLNQVPLGNSIPYLGINQQRPQMPMPMPIPMPMQMPKYDNWSNIYGNFKTNYQNHQQVRQKQEPPKEQRQKSQYKQEQTSSDQSFDGLMEDDEQNQSQSSYQKTQGFTKSQADKSETKSMTMTFKSNRSDKPLKISHAQKRVGKFNCFVKVLVIIQKQIKFCGTICTRFLAGDKTGVAIFMMEYSPLVQPGDNILLESIRWANFNHEKQGQFTEKTKITLHDEPIKVIGPFRFGQNATKLFNDNAKQIQFLIGREYSKFRKQEKEAKKQFVQKEKPEEKKSSNQPQQQKPINHVHIQGQSKPTTQQVQNLPPPLKKLKIGQIRPGQTGCWVTGQVLKIISNDGRKKVFVLGDETGMVNVEVDCAGSKVVRQGVIVYLQSYNVAVEDGFILMRQSAKGKIILCNESPASINRQNKISQKKYV